MGVQVKEWKGAWWIFVNHKGRRKAKRIGKGEEGEKAATAAAEKIQARLVLGDLSPLEKPRPREITLREYGHQACYRGKVHDGPPEVLAARAG